MILSSPFGTSLLECFRSLRLVAHHRRITCIGGDPSAIYGPSCLCFHYLHSYCGRQPSFWLDGFIATINPGLLPLKYLFREFQTITVTFNVIISTRFEPYVFEPGRVPTNPCYEETTIFFLICIGTIVTVFVYAPDEPYSKRFYNNSQFSSLFNQIQVLEKRSIVVKWIDLKYLTISLCFPPELLMGWALEAVALTLCLMFITDVGFQEFINFKSAPHFEYNLFILLVGITGGLFCYIWEVSFWMPESLK